jgi:hypothetical protein
MVMDIRNLPGLDLHQRGKGAGGKRKALADLAKNIYLQIGQNTKYKQFQRTYRDDRVAFAYDCLPKIRETLAPFQEEILANYDMGQRRQALRGPHSLGKTLVAALLTHHSVLAVDTDVKVPTLASNWRQLDKYLWPEIHKVARLLDWHLIGRDPYTRDEMMIHSIRTNGGMAEAFAVASSDAALIEGAHASFLFYIFDESKSVEEGMWDAAEGAFASEGSSLLGQEGFSECYWLSISTPGAPIGRFYSICMRSEGYLDWLVRHVTIDEVIAAKRVGVDWVAQRKKQWGENSAVYKNRVLGEFASDDTEGVIPLDWIERAFDRYREWDEAGRLGEGLGNRILGVDTARYGDDKTCFAERINDRVETLHKFEKQDIPVTAGWLKPLAVKSSEVRIEMDSGLGAGVFDILNTEQGGWATRTMNLTEVYMGAGTSYVDKTGTFRFSTTRSAAWWHLRELLDPNSGVDIALIPSDILLGDLAAPKYEIKYWHGMLTIFVEPKENIKKADRLGRSTDEGDAVVLCFWDYGGGGGGVVF